MKRASVLIAVLALTVTVTAFAQLGQGPIRGRGGRGRGGQLPPFPGQRGPGFDVVQATQEALKLTDDQTNRLRMMLDERVQADQKAQDNVQSKLDAIADIQAKSKPSESELTKATQSLREAEQGRREVNDKFRTSFLAMLTPEQKKTLDDINDAAARVATLNALGVLNNGRGGPGAPPPPPPNGPRRGGRGPGNRGNFGQIGFAPGPSSNPVTPEKVALGKKLFFDKSLSADGKTACSTCHDPEHAFADNRRLAVGVKNSEGTRNSPALINTGFSPSFFWDGRSPSLERQVLEPIRNVKELGLTDAELERKTGLKTTEVSAALASYVRTIRSTESKFDSFNAGQPDALTPLERAGFEVFRGKGQCAGCHGGPDLTDHQFHNTGVSWSKGRFEDEGRFAVTRDPRDHGAFKTPTLRDVALTAPYMHDGSVKTLEEVVEFYSDGGRDNPYLDPRVRSRRLSSGEKLALVAFMKTLSGRVMDGM